MVRGYQNIEGRNYITPLADHLPTIHTAEFCLEYRHGHTPRMCLVRQHVMMLEYFYLHILVDLKH
jgi:hypothetical protein